MRSAALPLILPKPNCMWYQPPWGGHPELGSRKAPQPLGIKESSTSAGVMRRERVRGKATKREAERAVPVEKPQLAQFELFHLPLNIQRGAGTSGVPSPSSSLLENFGWCLPLPPSTQTLSCRHAQGKGGRAEQKPQANVLVQYFPSSDRRTRDSNRV